MKKPICCALLFAFSLPAYAVHVSPRHEGQVLIYPYYTVERNQQTLLTVRNNTAESKALQVRFRESENGRTVLSFHLYLGANDVWTASVLDDPRTTAERPAVLSTADDTCTVPGIKLASFTLPTLPNGLNYVPFRNFGYIGNRADGGSSSISRTRTGFVEIIEMGTLAADSVADIAAREPSINNCGMLNRAWTLPAGFWITQPGRDLLPPSGGLSGDLTLVDVASGQAASAPATALEHFSVIVQHPAPGNESLTLASAVTEADSTEVVSSVQTGKGPVQSRWPRARAAEAVSAALAVDHIAAGFAVTDGYSTEWLLSFPTRHLHTDPALVAAPVPPFTQRYVSSAVAGTRSCDSARFRAWGDDGMVVAPDDVLLPGTGGLQLCGSATRISFGAQRPSVMTSELPSWVYTGLAPTGHARFDFSAFSSESAKDGERWIGLPVIGVKLTELRRADDRSRTLQPIGGDAGCADCE